MSQSILAWFLAAIGIALGAGLTVLDAANDHRIAPPIVGAFLGAAFLGVGTLVATRRPGNPIGWIYLGGMILALYGGYSNFADQYAYYAVVTRPGSLPAPAVVAWLSQPALTIGFSSLLLLPLLLFPDGRLPSPRWRTIVIVGVVTTVALAILEALAPGPLRSSVELQNPFGIGGIDPELANRLNIPLIVVVLAAVAAPFVRFRRAAGPERQQLKWFAYGTAWIGVVFLAGLGLSVVAPSTMAVNSAAAANLWPLSVAGIPIATAIGILRHRLYDIDVLIRRTIVYGALSAILAVTYFVSVLALETVLRPLTAGSELAVALSTLAVVALFAPVRARIQTTVDRRFYRSRYDAARTLDEFSTRLRDEVDLDAVRADLIDAVASTVQPAHASVWLRR